MILKFKKQCAIVFFTMLLLCVSNAKYLMDIGLSSYFEYGVYFILLCEIWLGLIRRGGRKFRQKTFFFFLFVSFLFSIGLLVQNLGISTKLRLVATMIVLSSASITSGEYMDSYEAIRAGGYGLFVGTIVTSILSVLNGLSLYETVHEGMFATGFTGGMQFKNFYGAVILGSFMSLFFYNRSVKRKRSDLVVMILEIVLIFLSGSRGTYIMFFIFLCAQYYKQLSRIKKRDRVFVVLLVLLVVGIVGVVFYQDIALKSSTYLFRYRGAQNYLNYVKGDWFHIFFGNAELAWSSSTEDYTTVLRRICGWDGSYEMGFLNILIKNGIIGIVGFVLIFIRNIHICTKSSDWAHKVACISVLIVLLVSTFVESFISNIHGIFGVYCYLLMTAICEMIRKERSRKQLE